MARFEYAQSVIDDVSNILIYTKTKWGAAAAESYSARPNSFYLLLHWEMGGLHWDSSFGIPILSYITG